MTLIRRAFTGTAGRAALAIAAALLWVGMNTAGTFLSDAHLPGTTKPSMTALASPTITAARAEEIVGTWNDWDVSTELTGQDRARPWQWWWLAADCTFAVTLAGLLAALARHRRATVPLPPLNSRPRAAYDLLGTVRGVAVAYAAADIAENGLTAWVLLAEDPTSIVPLLALTSFVKWVVLVAAIAPLLIAAVVFWSDGRDRRRNTWYTIVDLRPQVVACGLMTILLVALPGSVRAQLHDLLLGWRNDPWEFIAAAVAITVLVATAAISGAARIQRAHDNDDPMTIGYLERTRFIVVAAAAALLLGAGALAHATLGAGWIGYVPAAGMIGWLVLSWPAPVRSITRTWPAYSPRAGVLRIVAFLPLVALFIAWVRAATPVLTPALIVSTGAGSLVLLTAWVLVWTWQLPRDTNTNAAGPRPWLRELREHEVVIALAGAGAVALLVVAAGWQAVPPRVGSVAIVGAGAIAVLGGLSPATSLRLSPPRGALAMLGFRRFPTLSAVLVAGVAVSLAANEPGFHLASVIDRPGSTEETRSPFPAHRALHFWDQATPTAVVTPAGESWRPLVIVSAAGGGGRAAYWTLLALNCAFGLDRSLRSAPACGSLPAGPESAHTRVFAASGISGGSVGLAMFERANGWDDPVDADALFEAGFVDHIVANMVAVDLPNAFVQTPRWDDRADALEQAWEARLPRLSEPYFGSWKHDELAREWNPLLLLNSTGAEDGCRVSVSPLSVAPQLRPHPLPDSDLAASCRAVTDPPVRMRRGSVIQSPWPATRDLRHILCRDQDVRTSTAALLSARFPYVSPTGAVPYCGEPKRFTFLMDGGAVDSSAAEPSALLVDEVISIVAQGNRARAGDEPCIQPIVLQLDNGYEDVTASAAPTRPRELIAPVTGGLRAITANAERARQRLALSASRLRHLAGCGGRIGGPPDIPTFLHVYPQSHPGVEAPLGWSLSRTSQEDMRTQLRGARNQCALLALRFWLTGSTNQWTCAAGTVEHGNGRAAPRERVCLNSAGRDRADGLSTVQTDAFGGFAVLANRDALPDPVLRACGVKDSPPSVIGPGLRDGVGRLAFDMRFTTSTDE